jgi:hypothetical protein
MIAKRHYAYLSIIILRLYIYSERERDYRKIRSKNPGGEADITAM